MMNMGLDIGSHHIDQTEVQPKKTKKKKKEVLRFDGDQTSCGKFLRKMEKTTIV